jgi:hypothetical protein
MSEQSYYISPKEVQALRKRIKKLEAELEEQKTLNDRRLMDVRLKDKRIEDFILRLESLPRHPAPDQPANMETGKWIQWDALLSVVEDMRDDNGD